MVCRNSGYQRALRRGDSSLSYPLEAAPHGTGAPRKSASRTQRETVRDALELSSSGVWAVK